MIWPEQVNQNIVDRISHLFFSISSSYTCSADFSMVQIRKVDSKLILVCGACSFSLEGLDKLADFDDNLEATISWQSRWSQWLSWKFVVEEAGLAKRRLSGRKTLMIWTRSSLSSWTIFPLQDLDFVFCWTILPCSGELSNINVITANFKSGHPFSLLDAEQRCCFLSQKMEV